MNDFENNSVSIDGDTVTLSGIPLPPVIMTREAYLARQQKLVDDANDELSRLSQSRATSVSQTASCDDDIELQNAKIAAVQSVISWISQ